MKTLKAALPPRVSSQTKIIRIHNGTSWLMNEGYERKPLHQWPSLTWGWGVRDGLFLILNGGVAEGMMGEGVQEGGAAYAQADARHTNAKGVYGTDEQRQHVKQNNCFSSQTIWDLFHTNVAFLP